MSTAQIMKMTTVNPETVSKSVKQAANDDVTASHAEMQISKHLMRLTQQPSDRHVSIRTLQKQVGSNAPRLSGALSPHLSLFNLSHGRRRSLHQSRYPGANGRLIGEGQMDAASDTVNTRVKNIKPLL